MPGQAGITRAAADPGPIPGQCHMRLAHTHTYVRGDEVVRYRNRPPAMAAGLTHRVSTQLTA